MVFVFRDQDRDGRLVREEWAAGDPNQIAAFKLRDVNKEWRGDYAKEAIGFGRRGGGAVA